MVMMLTVKPSQVRPGQTRKSYVLLSGKFPHLYHRFLSFFFFLTSSKDKTQLHPLLLALPSILPLPHISQCHCLASIWLLLLAQCSQLWQTPALCLNKQNSLFPQGYFDICSLASFFLRPFFPSGSLHFCVSHEDFSQILITSTKSTHEEFPACVSLFLEIATAQGQEEKETFYFSLQFWAN